jgi:hypothetical protein
MGLLRLIASLLFYVLAIVMGLAKRLFNRVGHDAIDMGDLIHHGGDPDSTHIRNIAEEWKGINDRNKR